MNISKEQVVKAMKSLQEYVNGNNILTFQDKKVYEIYFEDVIRIAIDAEYSPFIMLVGNKIGMPKQELQELTYENFNNFLDMFKVYTLTSAIISVKDEFHNDVFEQADAYEN